MTFTYWKGNREPNLSECEDLAKAIINRHVVIQILLAFPKLDFEVGHLLLISCIGTQIFHTSILYSIKS